ncbi:383_t:CDS:2 [Rhizophagus irregularis]|nr:383_t:CDS:2 [Rhizophagus irregularis]
MLQCVAIRKNGYNYRILPLSLLFDLNQNHENQNKKKSGFEFDDNAGRI